MTNIVVTTEVENHRTRSPDPNDGWDIGDEEGSVTNVTAYVVDSLDHYYGDSYGKELDVEAGGTVYAVVADYSSGCTFGRTGAQGKVLNVYTDPLDAEALAAAALRPESYVERYGQKVPQFDYEFTFEGQDYWRSWVGYFEDLQDLSVWEVQVRSHCCDPFDRSSGTFGYKRGH